MMQYLHIISVYLLVNLLTYGGGFARLTQETQKVVRSTGHLSKVREVSTVAGADTLSPGS